MCQGTRTPVGPHCVDSARASALPARLVTYAHPRQVLPAAHELGRQTVPARRSASRGDVPAPQEPANGSSTRSQSVAEVAEVPATVLDSHADREPTVGALSSSMGPDLDDAARGPCSQSSGRPP
jgi:hypothetical protein